MMKKTGWNLLEAGNVRGELNLLKQEHRRDPLKDLEDKVTRGGAITS
jgi:hypothetical protein